MVIGAFFSEVGTGLLRILAELDSDAIKITGELTISTHWLNQDFDKVKKRIKNHRYKSSWSRENLVLLRDQLVIKRDFLLRLLENPNLLEHGYHRRTFHLWLGSGLLYLAPVGGKENKRLTRMFTVPGSLFWLTPLSTLHESRGGQWL